jgi:hypothetical protein
MSTILYNTTNSTILGTFNPYYLVDGQRPTLSDGIVELILNYTDRPTIGANQVIETTWQVQGTEYVEVHNVRDKTAQEIADEKEAATPTEITKRQLLMYLFTNLNITPAMIDNLIATMEDEFQKALLLIEWQYATTIDRTNGNVIAFAAAMGISEEQLKEIYYHAKDI